MIKQRKQNQAWDLLVQRKGYKHLEKINIQENIHYVLTKFSSKWSRGEQLF